MTNHVTSLELSKGLIEVGIELETEFWWGQYNAPNQFEGDWKVCTDLTTSDRVQYDKVYPAPLASELGEVLPIGLLIEKPNSFYFVKYPEKHEDYDYTMCTDRNLSNALAKMLIYLKENNLLESTDKRSNG